MRFDPEAREGARLRVWDRVEGDLVERVIAGDRTPCLTLDLHWMMCPVELELVEGVAMVGNFQCDANVWRRSESRARVIAPASPAVIAKNILRETRVEGFEFVAPDAAPNTSGASSIGVLAVQSPGVQAVRAPRSSRREASQQFPLLPAG